MSAWNWIIKPKLIIIPIIVTFLAFICLEI